MRDLQYGLKRLCARYKDGSFATRANRERMLSLMAEQLWHLGYRDLEVNGLKRRHINRLIVLWKSQGLTPGTLKNRLATLRWWAKRVGVASMIPPANDTLEIPRRQYLSPLSRATQITDEQLHAILDPYTRISIELQMHFGLRTAEAIKLIPSIADEGDRLLLRPSWCKGGRPRVVPIETQAQRSILNRAHRLTGNGGLIGPGRNYVEQLSVYRYEMRRIGFHRPHGLRHKYAQQRYETLSGQPAPVNGGPEAPTSVEYAADHQARMQVSAELGHARKGITSSYLGAVRAAKKK